MDRPIYKICLEIPFPTKRHAEIAFDVMRVDAEPKRSKVTKDLDVQDNILKVNFHGSEVKNLRVGVSSFFEHILLCTETMESMGPPMSEQYAHY